MEPQFGHKVRMEGNHSLLMVLGRRGANIDERLLAFQMKVVPFQRCHFTTPQAGVNGGEINDLPRSGNSEETLHFIVSKGAARPHLSAIGLHLLNVLKWIARNALMLLHPVKERRNRAEILVESLRGKRLLGPPCLKRIGGDVSQKNPAAVSHQSPHPVLHLVDILTIAIQCAQIGQVFFQVLFQRKLSGITQGFRRQHSYGFELSILDDFFQTLLSHPFVTGVERNVIDLGFSFEPITAPVEPRDLGLAVLCSLGAKDGANHKILSICVPLDRAFV